MIIRSYETADLLKVRSMNPGMAEDLMSQGNLLRDTAVLAFSEEEDFLGAAYLLKTSSFTERIPEPGTAKKDETAAALFPGKQSELPCFLKGVFQAIPGPGEIEVSEKLLEHLKKCTEELQEKKPENRIILQIFGDAGALAYQEFLMEEGFQPKQLMTRMECSLTDLSDLSRGKGIAFSEGRESGGFQEKFKGFLKNMIRVLNPRDTAFDGEDEDGGPDLSRLGYYTSDDHWDPEAYRSLSMEAFGNMPDSEEDIAFLLDHGGKVYFAEDGEGLVSTVMTYRLDRETAATENICCCAKYRRRGVTYGLLKEVLYRLQEQGYEKARLNIFSDNLPAFSLYRKLGYEVTGNLIEYHYETRPRYRAY